jgi:hypothetical protein
MTRFEARLRRTLAGLLAEVPESGAESAEGTLR